MKRIMFVCSLMFVISGYAQDADQVKKLLQYRKYNTAQQKARELVSANQGAGQYWFWLTQALAQGKDSAELVGLSLPASGDAWIKLAKANILLAKGETGAARTAFDEAIGNSRRKDWDVVVAAARSNIYQANGDKAWAVELLKQAIRKDKRNPELHTLLGDAWFRQKNGSEAYAAYQEALRANSSYAPALFEIGKIFATQSNEELYLKYYNEAVNADPAFAPAWYELYYHHYSKDLAKAYDYYQKYLAVAERKPSDEYQLTDLLYLTKKYDEAIARANEILAKPGADNRLNKLLGYTYEAKGEPEKAISYMNRYFDAGADTAFLIKDYELMAGIYNKAGKADSATAWYLRALPLLKDSAVMVKYYKTLAAHYKDKKDYPNHALWAGNYYRYSDRVTNVDLFNWGLASYQAGNYTTADSVFGVYSEKYPDHVFGPYWRARANAAIDTTMTQGLAVPYYEQMISIAEKDTSNATNRRYLAEAYGYIAAYVANEKKDFPTAIDYFEKLLVVDPGNDDAKRYIEILERNVNSSSN